VRGGALANERTQVPVPLTDKPITIRIRTLVTSELIDAVERLCAGDSVRTVFQWMRKHGSEYEYSRERDLYQDLKDLSMRVQERVAANLANIRDAVLRTQISPATKKRYDAIISSNDPAARSTIGQDTLRLMSARKMLEFIFGSMVNRMSAWKKMQDKCKILCMDAGRDLTLLTRPIHHLNLLECQELWSQFLGSRPCEPDYADQQTTADLDRIDRIVDECLQFGEARRVLTAVGDHVLAEFAEHRAIEKVTGVPSAAGRRDLNALIIVAEDLRKLELNESVWRLKHLGRHIFRRAWRALLVGDLESIWQFTGPQ
jgi:hypothetical protein